MDPVAVLPWGRFDDLVAGSGLLFTDVEREIVAWRPDEVAPLLDEVDRVAAAGRWAFGFVAYEAASGLDPGLVTHDPEPGLPLAWFGIARPRAVPPVTAGPPDPQTGSWRPVWTEAEHRAAVRAVRERIADGETYQCNLTTSFTASAPDDPERLYRRLALNQRGRYNAYLDIGPVAVASASPELFFETAGRHVTMRPMKGTAPRGRTEAEDAAAARRLRSCPKERAENVMIVDLVRNDLARIAVTGSVAVTDLVRAERFETVHQLTSTVTARLRDDVGLRETFRALFPCGSVTGAPKQRTMELIRELETGPRGVYCGALGVVGPAGARFSVAIRTAVVDRGRAVATYGAGGGITWGSRPGAEWRELRAKARLLDVVPEDFHLIETMRHDPGSGLHRRAAHLARIASSARYFGFRLDLDDAHRALDRTLAGAGPARVRLTLHRDGSLAVERHPLPVPTPGPVRLAVDPEPVDASTCWTRHKTSRRDVYDVRRARHPDVDDVVLVDGAGEVTETCVATLAARIDGLWCTPPLSSGCLPGVERAHLVAAGVLRERRITVDELTTARELAVVSSLRGWRTAVLAGGADRPRHRATSGTGQASSNT